MRNHHLCERDSGGELNLTQNPPDRLNLVLRDRSSNSRYPP